ncbi:hypothetical protein MKW94_003509 [Papaver nudicaule]|uniref:Uncharacterized protein n=1 Tax=Papaver nudicaule TaxID=74823 RepID=A0AA41UWV3_PAPNU|nr:hypothetical protein [Papaver nudicaule]
MASISKRDKQQRKQSTSRLQRRAPASIQVNPASSFAQGWKVAIPLLSPLAMSPTSPQFNGDRTADISSASASSSSVSAEKANLIKSNWQHPSAPFHYDPTNNINKPAKQFVPSFVPRCR